MQDRNITWEGIEYNSLENCSLHFSREGAVIQSEINGMHDKKTYRVRYTIKTNSAWETLSCSVEFYSEGENILYELQQIGQQRWTLNGVYNSGFDGCTDVDIPLTPFTNTLPIKRLPLQPAAEAHIRVVYLDVLEAQVRPVTQQYKKLSESLYHYENVPNDFEADIEVDSEGLILYYPALFRRISR